MGRVSGLGNSYAAFAFAAADVACCLVVKRGGGSTFSATGSDRTAPHSAHHQVFFCAVNKITFARTHVVFAATRATSSLKARVSSVCRLGRGRNTGKLHRWLCAAKCADSIDSMS